MAKKEKNRLKSIKCARCKGIMMLHGIVWDTELKEFRLAIECLICKSAGLLIIRPTETGAKQEMKYEKRPSYLG